MKPDRFLPRLLLLFVGSGCAALIYEVVWFQLLELVIGSSAVSMGVLLGTFMGGMCLGSLLLPRVLSGRRASAARLRGLELGIGVFGLLRALRHAARRRRLHGVGRHRRRRHPAPRRRRRHLPAAADAADGRDAAGDRALGRGDAARRGLARILLRRQHRGRGRRQPARRLLPAARLRHLPIATYVAVALNVAVAVVAIAVAARGAVRAAAPIVGAGARARCADRCGRLRRRSRCRA